MGKLKKEGGVYLMVNQKKFKDLMIIDPDGNIIYSDVGNPYYFKNQNYTVTDMKLDQLYEKFSPDYPTLCAARTGKSFSYFETRVTFTGNNTLTKIGCAYPIYDHKKIVAAIEFSNLVYDKNDIRKIEDNRDHLMYRSNNTKYLIDDIITCDEEMLKIKKNIEKVAISDANVLIYGQTGVGKELVAQSLHNESRRFSKKFISVNCGALPEGIVEALLFGTIKGSFTGASDKPGFFELAEGGTLFLDEINSLTMAMQVKILKAVESKSVRRIGSLKEQKIDLRIIAATNEDPHILMNQGRLKPDLFYRLSTIYIKVPRLANRKGDIELLSDYFRKYFNDQMNMHIEPFSNEILEIFNRYAWPGNVRELRNIIEGTFAFADNNRIEIRDLPKYIINYIPDRTGVGLFTESPSMTLKEKTEKLEKLLIAELYKKNQGSLTDTANDLGISKQLLRYKLDKEKDKWE